MLRFCNWSATAVTDEARYHTGYSYYKQACADTVKTSNKFTTTTTTKKKKWCVLSTTFSWGRRNDNVPSFHIAYARKRRKSPAVERNMARYGCHDPLRPQHIQQVCAHAVTVTVRVTSVLSDSAVWHCRTCRRPCRCSQTRRFRLFLRGQLGKGLTDP